jgi:hypothetical protein
MLLGKITSLILYLYVQTYLHIEKTITTVLKEIILVHLRVEHIGLMVKVLTKFRLSSALPAAPTEQILLIL